jgi:RNA polymerase-interacting CarD/CdnL/TRCF family regulator
VEPPRPGIRNEDQFRRPGFDRGSIRDLKRSNDDGEQSYSERQIYQSALERLAREVAAVQKITEVKATAKLETMLGTLKKKEAA